MAPTARRLIAEWQTPIYRLAYQRLGNESDAWDATQEACLLLLRDADQLRSPDKLRPWVYRVAHNVILKQLRSLIARRRRETAAAERTADHVRDDRDLERSEENERVRRAVRGLKEELQAVVVLRYFQGLSEREVAAVLELPRTTIQYRLKKALNALRPELAAAGAAAPDLPSLLSSLSWPMPPSSLEAAALSAAPSQPALWATSGGAIMKAKFTNIGAIALAALAFGGGVALGFGSKSAESRSKDQADTASAAAETEERRRLEARLEGLERERANLSSELIALRAEKAAWKARPAPRVRARSTVELPEDWSSISASRRRAILARLGAQDPGDAVAQIAAVLASGRDAIFDRSFQASAETFSGTAPTLRFALILLLGEIGGDEALSLLRETIEKGQTEADLYAASLALHRGDALEDQDRRALVSSFKRVLGREVSLTTASGMSLDRALMRWFEELLPTLDPELRAGVESMRQGRRVAPELEAQVRAALAAHNERFPMPQAAPGFQLSELGAVLRGFDIANFLPELRQRALAGRDRELRDLALGLEPERAAAELREIRRVAIRSDSPYRPGEIPKLLALTGADAAHAYLLEEYQGLGADERRCVVEGARMSLGQVGLGRELRDSLTFRTDRNALSVERAQATIFFLEALLPLTPEQDLRKSVTEAIAMARQRYQLP